MTVEDFERTMQVNFWAAFHVNRAARPHLHGERGARIVNIASIGGRIAVPHLAPYSASKFALAGYSSALATELARENIRVTTVSPGLLRHGVARESGVQGPAREGIRLVCHVEQFSVRIRPAPKAPARQIVEACRRGQAVLTFSVEHTRGRDRAGGFPEYHRPGARRS